ncbi:MAG TPA: hypothetical protein DF610_19670, partial [Sphingobacterium sp.]|nr:hypothetical protein [Sphingobacterium sp.]
NSANKKTGRPISKTGRTGIRKWQQWWPHCQFTRH